MTFKNNRAPLLYCTKLCASFQSHWWIQTGVRVRKRSIWVKISDFVSHVNLKFNGWPWKTIGHLFSTTFSFVHYFKASGEFKLELQSGNAQFRSKSAFFCPVWPWNLMDDYQQGKSEGFESWTGLVISNWIQIVNFSARVTMKFDGWPCKTIGHLFYATSSFVHLFVPIGELKLKLQSGNAQSGSNWMIFRAVRPWNLTDDLAIQ